MATLRKVTGRVEEAGLPLGAGSQKTPGVIAGGDRDEPSEIMGHRALNLYALSIEKKQGNKLNIVYDTLRKDWFLFVKYAYSYSTTWSYRYFDPTRLNGYTTRT